ncbi:MAG: hypothetical protein KDK70_16075 [Myxococcales bacterium]|nr:hypothetical protein [Myxococcales bacterium]
MPTDHDHLEHDRDRFGSNHRDQWEHRPRVASGDVLTHVDGASLGAMETLERVLVELPTAPAWALTMRRWTGSAWELRPITIARAP